MITNFTEFEDKSMACLEEYLNYLYDVHLTQTKEIFTEDDVEAVQRRDETEIVMKHVRIALEYMKMYHNVQDCAKKRQILER